MPRTKLKLIVFQIRKYDEIANHEFNVVADTAKLDVHQFTRINVYKGERIDLEKLSDFDGIIIGGSGACSVLENHDFNPYLRNIARYAKERNIPFLGLCYGFQIAVQALGGTMIHDKASMETGAYPANLHENAQSDPLLCGLPDGLLIPCGREDRATKLPPGAVSYVQTELCPIHHLTFPGTKFHGVQFHPELWKKEDNLKRIVFYGKKYNLTEDQFALIAKKFIDAPLSAKVLENFIDNVILS